MVKRSQGTHPGMGFRGNILGNKEKDGCGKEYLRIGLNGVPEEIIFAKAIRGRHDQDLDTISYRVGMLITLSSQ